MIFNFDYYIGKAREAEDRSTGLWKGMNQVVRSVLETQKKKGETLDYVADVLDYVAGKPKKRHGDMVSIENIRIAARQIRAREELVLP